MVVEEGSCVDLVGYFININGLYSVGRLYSIGVFGCNSGRGG